jgi:WD40 repeat protein
MSPDGSLGLSCGGSGKGSGNSESPHNWVRIWDLKEGKESRCLKGHKADVWSVAFSPDGTRILSGGGDYDGDFNPVDCTVRLWDTATGKELKCYSGHVKRVTCVAFSPDGKFAASASMDKTIRIWKLPGGE